MLKRYRERVQISNAVQLLVHTMLVIGGRDMDAGEVSIRLHRQPAGLVAEDAVNAGDGLHESVARHRLVGIHRVHAGRVEAGQPRTAGCLTLAHDHNLERVLGVLEAVRQLLFYETQNYIFPYSYNINEY